MLRHEYPAGGVTLLLLDRPEVYNALDLALVAALDSHLSAVAADPAARAVVLGTTREGRFCSGADLAVPDSERALVSDELYGLYERMITLPVPVIAAVDGAAVGGGAQLALASDVRLGSERARFRFAGPGHGLAVGAWALPSTVGRRGMELMLGGRFVGAAEASGIGLLDRVVADPLAEAMEFARAVTELDGAAVRRAKRAVVSAERLHERLAEERAGNAKVFTGYIPM